MGSLEKRIADLQDENELLRLQLHQAQEELERYFLLNQEYERKVADLTRLVEAAQPAVPDNAGLFSKLTDLLGITIHDKIHSVRTSGLFDERWYLQRYPDVAKAGMDPVEHYLRYGASEGRDPGPQFDTRWYLANNHDVADSDINPLLHYVRYGRNAGRQPRRGGMQRPPDTFANERRWLQSAREEQARLAAERQRQIKVLSQASAALEQEKSALAGRCDELEMEMSGLAQARDEQALLAAERQRQIDALIQARAALEQEKSALEQEKSALAGRLAEAQQRLQQQEGHAVETSHRQQLMHEELVRAEAQIDLIKEVLLREPGL